MTEEDREFEEWLKTGPSDADRPEVEQPKVIKTTQQIIREFYGEIMPSFKTPQRTVKDAIGDLPKIFPIEEVVKVNGRKF